MSSTVILQAIQRKQMMEIWTESTKFNTSQRLTDLTRLILRKGLFSDLEIQEMFGHVEIVKYIVQQSLPKRVGTPNFEKQPVKDSTITQSILTPKSKKKNKKKTM